jgi:hypothetical protein
MNMPGFTAEAALYRVGECYQAAYANGASEHTVRANDIVPGAVLQSQRSLRGVSHPSPEALADLRGLPLYGNHCGPFHGDPNVGWIDRVDEACYWHDRCYEGEGYFDCSCDQTLLNTLRPLRSIWTKQGRAAYVVYEWFYRQPCIPGT